MSLDRHCDCCRKQVNTGDYCSIDIREGSASPFSRVDICRECLPVVTGKVTAAMLIEKLKQALGLTR